MKKILLPILAIFLTLSCENAIQKTSILLQKTKALETMKRIHKIDRLFRKILDNKIPFYHSANSIEELKKNAPSAFFNEVSIRDSWGNIILFFWDQSNNEYGIASSGNDGKFDGWKQRGFYNGDILCGYKNDIVLINGKFVYGPDARPDRNSRKLVIPALKSFAKGDLNSALKFLSNVQQKYPFNLYANVLLGAAYFFLGQNQQAIDIFKHAKRHFSKNSEINLFLSLCYCEMDEMTKSMQYLLSSNFTLNESNYSLTGVSAFKTEINFWIKFKATKFRDPEMIPKKIIDYYENLNHFPYYSQLYSMIFYQLGEIQSALQNFTKAVYFFKKSISFGKPGEIFFLKSRSELSKLQAIIKKSNR